MATQIPYIQLDRGILKTTKLDYLDELQVRDLERLREEVTAHSWVVEVRVVVGFCIGAIEEELLADR